MADEEQERFDQDIARLAALREELAGLAVAAKGELSESDIDEAMQMRDAIIDLVNNRRGLTMTIAMCDVLYWIIEQLENASIANFVREKSEGLNG